MLSGRTGPAHRRRGLPTTDYPWTHGRAESAATPAGRTPRTRTATAAQSRNGGQAVGIGSEGASFGSPGHWGIYFGRGPDDLLQLIVEIKGYRREDAKEKKSTMDTYWVPGVNNSGHYGRWAFAELTEIYRIEADFEAEDVDEAEIEDDDVEIARLQRGAVFPERSIVKHDAHLVLQGFDTQLAWQQSTNLAQLYCPRSLSRGILLFAASSTNALHVRPINCRIR